MSKQDGMDDQGDNVDLEEEADDQGDEADEDNEADNDIENMPDCAYEGDKEDEDGYDGGHGSVRPGGSLQQCASAGALGDRARGLPLATRGGGAATESPEQLGLPSLGPSRLSMPPHPSI